jgi:hypothetical protein
VEAGGSRELVRISAKVARVQGRADYRVEHAAAKMGSARSRSCMFLCC